MKRVARKKVLPAICLKEMNLQFYNSGDAKKLSDLLLKEPLIEIVHHVTQGDHSNPQDSFGTILYLITEMGTIVGLFYDFSKERVIKLQITDYLKSLVCFKIRQIQVTQGDEHIQLSMLIEHDCLCLVQLQKYDQDFSLLNDSSHPLSIGLAQCEVLNADKLKVNEHAVETPFIIVQNDQMMEIFVAKSLKDNKLQLQRILIVELAQLPLIIRDLNSFSFDFHDPKVFYAIGETNQEFEDNENLSDQQEELDGLNKTAKIHSLANKVRFEKFFIESAETFQSQTVALLKLGSNSEQQEKVTKFEISQSHDILAIVTNHQNLYIYDLAEMHYLYNKKQNQLETRERKDTAGLGTKIDAINTFEGDSAGDSYKLDQDLKGFQENLDSSGKIMEDLESVPVKGSNLTIEPIASFQNLGQDIAELKWVLNDTFFVVITAQNQMVIFDSLCNIFTQITTDGSSKSNDLKYGKSLSKKAVQEQDYTQFRVKGYQARLSSYHGLPVLTNSKYITLAAYNQSNPKGFFAKIIYFETSNDLMQKSTFLTQEPMSHSYVVNCHLQANRPNQVAKLLLSVIHDSEIWLSSCIQLFNYMMRHPKDLISHKVSKESFVKLLDLCKAKDEHFNALVPAVEFCLLRLGLKYLTLELIDEALYVAFKSSNQQLTLACKSWAQKKKHVMALNLIEFHQEKCTPGQQSSLVRSLTQIANFSQKSLRKEDYSNLYKDFETLLKIDDITDLELSDFNGWEINLEQYQKALDLEFEGFFSDAEKIYEANGIKNDVARVKNLQKELNKELREGEQYLTLVNINDLLKEYQKASNS